MVIVMRFLKEYKIVGVAIVVVLYFFQPLNVIIIVDVVVVASDWCFIFPFRPFCHRSYSNKIICEIAHQIATIRLLLNGWPFYLFVTLLWLRHVVILRFILYLPPSLSLSPCLTHFFMNVYVRLFGLRQFIILEDLVFFSFTDLQWKPGDFMAQINAIKYVLNRHKKDHFNIFSAVFADWLAGWLATSYPSEMAIFRTKITTLKPSTTLTK